MSKSRYSGFRHRSVKHTERFYGDWGLYLAVDRAMRCLFEGCGAIRISCDDGREYEISPWDGWFPENAQGKCLFAGVVEWCTAEC